MLPRKDCIDQACTLLRHLFPVAHNVPEAGHYLCVWTKKGPAATDPKKSRHFRLDDLQAAAEYAVTESEDGWDTYFTVAAHGADLGPNSRGRIDEKTFGWCLYLDIDSRGAPGHKAAPEQLWSDEDVVLCLQTLGISPNAVVRTGGGYHLYVFLDRAYPAAEVGATCKAFQEAVRRFGEARGLVTDATGNIAQVLRVPGSYNWKTGEPRRVTFEIAPCGERHTLEALRAKFPPLPAGHKKQGSASIDEADPALKEGLLTLARNRIKAKAKKLTKSNRDAEAVRLLQVLEGKPFATAGRNSNLTSLIYQVKQVVRINDPQIVTDVIRPSYEAMRAANPADSDFGDLDRMVAQAFKKLDAESEKRSAAHKAASSDRSRPLHDSGVAETCPPLPQNDGESYSLALIDFRIREQARLSGFPHSRESFVPRIGVRMPTGDSLRAYSFRAGDYIEMTSGAFAAWLLREVRRFPKEFYDPTQYDADGNATVKPLEQMVAELTVVPDEMNNEGGPIRGRLDIQAGYYDPVRQQFVEASSPRRRLEGKRSEIFEKFLEKALPNAVERERFNDHLAATQDLSSPSAGVRIQGEKNTGKTLVVVSASQTYGVTGATPGNLFYEHFNDWENPIISHDEKPSKNEHGEVIEPAEHREVITRETHIINKKHARKRIVNGYTRHFFPENGDRHFTFSGQTPAEMRATAERLDSFVFANAAAEWIAAEGGREFIRKQIESDEFARHVVWLGETRLPRLREESKRRGSRMLVEGNLQTSMADLMRGDRNASRVMHFVCRYIENPPVQNIRGLPAVLVSKGTLRVSVDSLIREWGDVMPHERKSPPDMDQVLAAVKLYALEPEKGSKPAKHCGKKGRYWSLDVTKVLEYADSLGAWDMEALREALALPEKKPEATEVAA
jgi:hypothetical protein